MAASQIINFQNTKQFSVFVSILWSVLVISSLALNFNQINLQAEYLAKQEAYANWNKDQAFRNWVTRHGGLYVKPDARTPPNPYLKHLPDRDVVTTDGVKLTLMNPAYMMSQMAKEFDTLYGIKGRITGQVLLNPANKPDAWELAALKKFDKGVKEVSELGLINNEPYMRLIKPMVMKQGCVLCHGYLGFKVGDIRGGVSISIPLKPYLDAADSNRKTLAISHVIVWLFGILGILLIYYRSHKLAIKQQETTSILEEKDSLIKDLLNSTGEGIYGLDMQGKCTFANPACAELLGYSSTEIFLGKNMHELVHYRHEDGTPYPQSDCLIYCAFINNQQVHNDREVFWRADGESFAVEYWAYPIIRDAEVRGAVVTFIDITERLQAERMLRQSKKMDALGQLTGGVAHDFNNQLGIISGFLEMLDEYPNKQDKHPVWIASSRKATDRCIDLTRQMLNFTRRKKSEHEVLNIESEIIHLKEVVQKNVKPSIQLNFKIKDGLWNIEANRIDLQDSIINLVINAQDAMKEGGQLTVAVENQHLDNDRMILNDIAPTGDYVVFSIADTGHGIAQNILEQIFDPFFSSKTSGKGTGLGLAMVYGFIKRCNGYINVCSEVDVGTTIHLYLPAFSQKPRLQKNQVNSESVLSDKQQATILVVDDEAELRRYAKEILENEGFTVVEAEDGESAIECLKSGMKIDLLFSDVIMPGSMNGYQIAEKAIEIQSNIKIQLVSGLSEDNLSTKKQAKLGTHVLHKPYSRAYLIKCIKLRLDQ